MTLEARTQALLDLVEEDRTRRCDAILGEARARAAQTIASAHADARTRIRNVFVEERDRMEASLRAANARLDTHRRLREQRRDAALLAAGHERLPDALHERWQRSDERARWIAQAIAEARNALPNDAWIVVHALPFAERSLFPDTAGLVADIALRAGVKIMAGGNVIDGSLAGLLADRVEIGARILAHLQTTS